MIKKIAGGKNMARKIVITSGKGGVGKTTITALLGNALSKTGERVVLCDTDLGLNNLDVVTGVENLIVYDIVDVIEGRCRARQALCQHPIYKNTYILPSNHFSKDRYVSPQAIKAVLDGLSPQFDYILVDCPAGIEDGFHRAVATADEAIVVTTPHISSLKDANSTITTLKSYKLKEIYLIVNMVRGDLLADNEIMSPMDIAEILKVKLIGVIPESKEVFLKANLSGETLRSFKYICHNLSNDSDNIKIFDATHKYQGFWGSIRKSLKKSL